MRPTCSVERTDRGYELTIGDVFYGWHQSNGAADRFRRVVMSGKPLDARNVALLAAARAEKAERDNRAAAQRIVDGAPVLGKEPCYE